MTINAVPNRPAEELSERELEGINGGVIDPNKERRKSNLPIAEPRHSRTRWLRRMR